MEDKSKILSELKKLEERIVPTLASQDAEIKAQGSTSSATARSLNELEKKHDALTLELKELNKNLIEVETKLGRPNMGAKSGIKQVGSAFMQSPQFKRMVETKGRTTETVDLGSLSQYQGWEQKGVSGNDQLRNVMSLLSDQQIYMDPLRPNRVRDLIPVFPTRFSLIEYVQENVLNINAAMVAEGAQKPESSVGFVDATTPVRTLAHWMPVARQLLDDLQGLESYLNTRLLGGLKMVEDDQILYGDGTGQNLTGLMVASGTQEATWSLGTHGDTQIDAIRRAMTLAQLAYYPVDGIVMNPVDWEKIELIKSTEGLYVWVNVATGSQPSLWKVPVVTTTAMHSGDVLLGAFSMACSLWDRQEASMRMSEHHADFFTKNMVAMLIEERIGLSVQRSKSLVKLTLDQAPA